MAFKLSITSFNKNSGATFIGVNLASMLADQELKTLFITFDSNFLTSKSFKELVALKSKTLTKNIRGYKKNRYLEILICKEKHAFDVKEYLRYNQKQYAFVIFNEKINAYFDELYDKIFYTFNLNDFNDTAFIQALHEIRKHHELNKLSWIGLNMYDSKNHQNVQNLMIIKRTFMNDVMLSTFDYDPKVEKQNYLDYCLKNPWSKNTIIINDLIKKLKSFSKNN